MPHIDQMKVWSILCGHSVTENQLITNPLRVDSKPGCWISRRGQDYRLFDYADRRFNGIRIIDAIMYKYNLSITEALNKMIELNNQSTLNLITIDYDKHNIASTFNFKLEYKPRIFMVKDRDYWQKRDITKEQLIEDKLEPVYVYRCNSRKYEGETFYFYPNLAYAIPFESGNVKILLPDTKKLRFITNCTEEDIGGIFNKEGDQLIVQKSYKDYRHIKNLGYNVCWTMNEGCEPQSLIELAKNFKEVVIFYDNDKGGIKASNKLKSLIPNSREVSIPLDFGCKDPDELKIMYGEINEIIYNIIN